MKLKLIIAAFIVGFILGFLCCYCFVSSFSEASPSALGTGLIESSQGAGLPLSLPQKRSGFITKTCPYFEVTAYCPCEKCCGKWSDGYTASGHKIVQGDRFVAAPPDIPFGTLLAIDGYAGGLPVPVLDRGGAIQGNKLDVFFNTHQEALAWGRRKLKVREIQWVMQKIPESQ